MACICDWRVKRNAMFTVPHTYSVSFLSPWDMPHSRYTPWESSIARTLVPHGQLTPWP